MSSDLLNRIIGAPVAALRAQRPPFVQHTQGSHDVLVTPEHPAGLSLSERASIAHRAAALCGHAALTAHYAALLAAHPPGNGHGDRRDALLRHAELVTLSPGRATRDDIAKLQQAGLSPQEIVTLSQIVAFVSYQARVAAGLSLLVMGTRP